MYAEPVLASSPCTNDIENVSSAGTRFLVNSEGQTQSCNYCNRFTGFHFFIHLTDINGVKRSIATCHKSRTILKNLRMKLKSLYP